MDPYEGFREFVRGRQQALMRTAYLLTDDGPQAEDLLQAVPMRTREAVASRFLIRRRRPRHGQPERRGSAGGARTIGTAAAGFSRREATNGPGQGPAAERSQARPCPSP
ncbi:hypothetical protein [Nonomuraea sp. SYSU D8015]|uniref:hypothetical protein n=1 Tax=Nonomuraea sp. SYSU D8015 TaxID=2593644 RepID=UPI0016611A75|nr:hypothetical protein [Nonomuraea sp. SYSU D8015]